MKSFESWIASIGKNNDRIDDESIRAVLDEYKIKLVYIYAETKPADTKNAHREMKKKYYDAIELLGEVVPSWMLDDAIKYLNNDLVTRDELIKIARSDLKTNLKALGCTDNFIRENISYMIQDLENPLQEATAK